MGEYFHVPLAWYCRVKWIRRNGAFVAGWHSDLVRGGGGPDQVNGVAGTDQLFGDEANDQLTGGVLALIDLTAAVERMRQVPARGILVYLEPADVSVTLRDILTAN
jgi:hypothetical protein